MPTNAESPFQGMRTGIAWFPDVPARGTIRRLAMTDGRKNPAWRRLGPPLRRVADVIPITPLGAFVILLASIGLYYVAYPRQDLVVFVAGSAALAVVGLATLVVIVATIALFFRLRSGAKAAETAEDALTMETGVERAQGFGLPGLRWLPLVRLQWSWEHPAGVDVTVARRGGRLEESATVSERGVIDRVRRRVVLEDVFGVARLAFRLREQRPRRVLPRADQLRRLPLLTAATGDDLPHPMGLEDGDRVDMRRYAPSDPARFIHWKVFARTRRLVVRVPERAISRSRRTVGYFVPGPDDDASAAAARVTLERAELGTEWVFGADLPEGTPSARTATNPTDGIALVLRSVRARARGGMGLGPFLENAERGGPVQAIVFVPPRPGPWLDRVAQEARRRRGRIRFVVGVDGLAAGRVRSLWRRLVAPAPVLHGVPIDALDEVVRTLGAARAEVIVVDRKTGRLLGDAHRARVRTEQAA